MSEESVFSIASTSNNSFWEPGNYKRVTKRIEDGYKLSNDLIELVQERAETEQSYAQSLKSWSKKWSEFIKQGPQYGTSQAVWKGFAVEATQIAQLHKRIKNDLITKVISSIQNWQKDNYHKTVLQLKEVKTVEDQFKKAQKQWEKELAKVKKAKQDYHNACKQERKLSDSTSDIAKKAEVRISKTNEGIQKTRKKYEKSLQEIKHYIPSYIDDMRKVFEICQDKEAIRLEFFKQVFFSIEKCVSLANKEILTQVYAELDRTINNADPDKDLLWWSENYGLSTLSPVPTFEEHPSDSQQHKPTLPELIPEESSTTPDQPDFSLQGVNKTASVKSVRFEEEVTIIEETLDFSEMMLDYQSEYNEYCDAISRASSDAEIVYYSTPTNKNETMSSIIAKDTEKELDQYSSNESVIETDIDNFSEINSTFLDAIISDAHHKIENISPGKILAMGDGEDLLSESAVANQIQNEQSKLRAFASEMAQQILISAVMFLNDVRRYETIEIDTRSLNQVSIEEDIEMEIQPLTFALNTDLRRVEDEGRCLAAYKCARLQVANSNLDVDEVRNEQFSNPNIETEVEDEPEVVHNKLSRTTSTATKHVKDTVEIDQMRMPAFFEVVQSDDNEESHPKTSDVEDANTTYGSVLLANEGIISESRSVLENINEERNSFSNSNSEEDSQLEDDQSVDTSSSDGYSGNEENRDSAPNNYFGTNIKRQVNTDVKPGLGSEVQENQQAVKTKSVVADYGIFYGRTFGWSVKHVAILVLIILLHYGLYLLIKS